jgi:hypothetical protein
LSPEQIPGPSHVCTTLLNPEVHIEDLIESPENPAPIIFVPSPTKIPQIRRKKCYSQKKVTNHRRLRFDPLHEDNGAVKWCEEVDKLAETFHWSDCELLVRVTTGLEDHDALIYLDDIFIGSQTVPKGLAKLERGLTGFSLKH